MRMVFITGDLKKMGLILALYFELKCISFTQYLVFLLVRPKSPTCPINCVAVMYAAYHNVTVVVAS